MILRSKKSDLYWHWIKVPRTGTNAYRNLFFPGSGIDTHFHTPFSAYNRALGVSVVRNPTTRFVSILRYIKEYNCTHDSCTKHNVSFPCSSVDDIYNFFYENFDKNCRLKPGRKLEEIFNVGDPSFVETFFKLQTHFVYHPKVKIFKYENLEEFNSWIVEELEYDISKLQIVNHTRKETLAHIDFSDPRITKIAEHLYYDDYQVFGYPLQYLT